MCFGGFDAVFFIPQLKKIFVAHSPKAQNLSQKKYGFWFLVRLSSTSFYFLLSISGL
jgi:hypothetical protein